MQDIVFFDAITDQLADQVGGKGLSLGMLASAGLPVPHGFVVTTDAYRRSRDSGAGRIDSRLRSEVEAAYVRLGRGLVAVRSSATAEDAADTSFAGQQETFLGIEGEAALVDAIERCWRSLHTERAAAYRTRQGVTDAGLAMAVVVQKLVPAEVAGVLFTRDPQDAAGGRMLAEAAWGLGEAVVSGRVTPDRFRLDRATGTVIDKHLGHKTVMVTAAGEEHVPPERQAQFCLSDVALSQLAELGRKVEAFYRDPRDVEWASLGGEFFLLQARPITVAGAGEREQIRQSVIAELRTKTDPKGTVWVRYNLSEVLPRPTPMTWAVVQRLLAADGGFGAMNRDFGAYPDPTLGSLGAFDLVAGRPMANLSRMPRMQSSRPPLRYPFAQYKNNPRLALDPVPSEPTDGILMRILRLPITLIRLGRFISAVAREAPRFADRYTNTIAPPFIAAARAALAQDWSKLDPPGLVAEFQTWVARTLIDFARDSLKATVLANHAWNNVVGLLTPRLGPDRAREATGALSLGAHPPARADLPAAIRKLEAGELTRAAFLEQFGHRSVNEMELAQPRWAEVPHELDRLTAGARVHTPHGPSTDFSRVVDEARITGPAREQLQAETDRTRQYLGLRETAKHDLLTGYAVIRRALIELDTRFALNGGIFFLTPDDFPELLAGKDVSTRIASARRLRQTQLTLEVPPVLFSDDLDAIGRPAPEAPGGAKLEGIALSAGVAEGPALVLTEPTAAPPQEGYVLVCPSTDPAWVPLFVGASALVMETGGVLSHGAIVAREFGLPAVAGLPGITDRLRTGDRIRVDGGRGTVTLVEPQS